MNKKISRMMPAFLQLNNVRCFLILTLSYKKHLKFMVDIKTTTATNMKFNSDCWAKYFFVVNVCFGAQEMDSFWNDVCWSYVELRKLNYQSIFVFVSDYKFLEKSVLYGFWFAFEWFNPIYFNPLSK